MEGWRFNPPRSWPVEADHEPERGWRPPPEWGPLPPGHQLWLPEHPRPRRRAPSVLALIAVAGLAAAAFAVPVRHHPEVSTIAWRSAAVAPVIDVPAAAEVGLPPSTIREKPVRTHPARHFPTCAALRAVYPHGVGRRAARDRTAGVPVTDFTRNAKVYAANQARDGDRDGIACEHP